MKLNEYQRLALESATYPNKGKIGGLSYTVLGLTGEAGEVANKLKKHIRARKRKLNRRELMDEVGDVLWYVAAVSKELGYTLSEVANCNIDKLRERVRKNQIKEHA